MVKYLYIIATVVQLMSVRECNGYPTGAPAKACSNLTPGHGAQLAGTSPFVANVQLVKSAIQYQVTISSSNNNTVFQGFILQARKIGATKPVGKFVNVPDHTHARKCSNDLDTATHSDITSKTSLTFTWIPPTPFNASVQFHATVAVNKGNYWKGIVSEEISITNTKSGKASATSSIFTLLVTNLVLVYACQSLFL